MPDAAAFAMLRWHRPIPVDIVGQDGAPPTQPLWARQLNRTIYTIVLTRLRLDSATRAYAERCRARGKTDRAIRRCLGRYVTRQLYRQLETEPLAALDAT